MKKYSRRKIRFNYKKRNVIIFLVFVFFLGMGYSVLGSNLSILGNINLSGYKEPTIRVTGSSDTYAFKNSTYKNKIKIINLDDEINPPSNVIQSWDYGVARNGNVMAPWRPRR